jgi:inorganic pyrophosphatase
MNINLIPTGEKAPDEFNVIIEIPANGPAVKYEIEKDSGAVFVDRFINVSMSYPCHYGFIPHTLSGDGDPCDVLVYVDVPLVPGCVVKVRPIGVLLMEDESGQDEKILAVPVVKSYPGLAQVQSYKDLPEITLKKITHFFERYKDLEQGKWVKVTGWQDADKAKEMVIEGINRAKK